MRALECSGADVDAADTDGNRPLHRAAAFWSGAALLESGAAIIILETYYYQDLRETLQMAGADAV